MDKLYFSPCIKVFSLSMSFFGTFPKISQDGKKPLKPGFCTFSTGFSTLMNIQRWKTIRHFAQEPKFPDFIIFFDIMRQKTNVRNQNGGIKIQICTRKIYTFRKAVNNKASARRSKAKKQSRPRGESRCKSPHIPHKSSRRRKGVSSKRKGSEDSKTTDCSAHSRSGEVR